MLLCHSLTAEECERVASIVRSRAERLEILTLAGAGDGSDAETTDQLGGVGTMPKKLLAAVRRFMKNRILPDSSRGESKRESGAKAARKHRVGNHKSNHRES